MGLTAHEETQNPAVTYMAKTRKRDAVYRLINFFYSDDRGASMVEYALLVILIAIIAFAAVALAGSQLSETYSEISSDLVNAGN